MYTFNSRIRYSECDSKCKLRLEALLNYFQDASTFQSEELGVGFDYLMPKNLVWVLANWQVEVNRYPKLGEEVVIGTFPYDFKKCLGYRNFCMMTPDGEMLARANTLWSLVNFDTMKFVMPPEELVEKYSLEPPLEMNFSEKRIIVGTEGRQVHPIIVGKQHLDSNNHVNNAQYVSMAASLLPEEMVVEKMRVEYRKQAHLNDVIYPYIAEEEEKVIISLRNEEEVPYVNIEFA